MSPRHGALYSAAVLRPFAEQLMLALDVEPGGTVLDIGCGSGVLSAALATAIGAGGTLLALDAEPGDVASARRSTTPHGCSVFGVAGDPAAIPLRSGSCDRAGSLFAIDVQQASRIFEEAARVTSRPGGVAALVWGMPAPLHEAAFNEAMRGVTGVAPAGAPVTPPQLNGIDVTVVRDVVRFDGFAQYWQARVNERTSRTVAGDALSEAQARCAAVLAPYIASDGTMRLPVDAWLLRPAS